MNPFLHPGLAWAALGLASIPIIIHLLNRQRQRKLDWAAMEFLLRALKRTRRRVRIEQLLLLLCRIVLIALIALALARPRLDDRDFGWLASAFKSEDKIFVVDDSLSMSRREAGGTTLDRAAEALANEIGSLGRRRGGQDRVTIVRSSRPEAPLLQDGFIDQERAAQIESTVKNLSPTSTSMDLAATLENIAQHAATSADSSTQRPRSVSILTDLRAADWTDGSGGASASLTQALERLQESEDNPARIVIYDVGGDDTTNIAITEVRLDARPTVDLPTQVRVRLRNHGNAPVANLRLTMHFGPVAAVGRSSGPAADGGMSFTALAPPIATIAAGETAVATIPCTFRTAGQYWASTSLSGSSDPIAGDNEFAFVVDVVDSTEILLIDGEPSSSGDRWDDETYYLSLALNPGGDANSGIVPVVAVEDSLPSGALDRFGGVFLANVYSLPEEFRRRLGRYVRGGGALFLFLGDQVRAAEWERDFGTAAGPADEDHPERDLLPATIGEVEGGETMDVRLLPSYDHPFFEFLRDGGEPYVQDIRFNRYFAVAPHPQARVIASFTGDADTPAFVERPVGAGRVYLFASSADREWNGWPRNVTYLMVLQKVIETMGTSRSQTVEYLAGQRLEVPIDIAEYANQARFRAPDYPRTPEGTLRASPRSAAENEGAEKAPDSEFVLTLEPQATLAAGHFFLAQRKRGSTVDEWSAIAIRSPTRESDLRRVTEDELRKLYPNADLRVVRDVARFSEAGHGQFEIADLLLALLIVLLFVEGALACWFAHHGRAAEGRAVGLQRLAARPALTATGAKEGS